MQTEVIKNRFTVEEYYKMDAAGILPIGVRTELLDGEVIEMTKMGARHASVLSRVNRLFVKLFNGKAILRPLLPFPINDFTEVQPDAALFKPAADYYGSAHPGPADVLLVVEIADSSLKYDHDMKLKVYAAANVPEVWISDLRGDSILVYRGPSGRTYKTSLSFKREDSISCLAFPDIPISVQELLA